MANGILWLTLGAIAVLLVLILYFKLHAFLAMLATSIGLGLAAGMAPAAVIKSVQFGFGDALGFIAIVLGLGAMIGAFVEHSGGGRALAEWLIAKFGRDRAQWAVLVAAFLVGLPIFFEVGFIILIPLIWSMTRESKRSLLYFGLALVAPLTMTHALVPPHPAPAAAAQLLGIDLGSAILYGALLSVPMAIAGGILFSRWIAPKMFVPVPSFAAEQMRAAEGRAPSPWLVLVLLLLPVLLILAAALAGPKQRFWALAGHPFVALGIALAGCMLLLGSVRGLSREKIGALAVASLQPIGSLLLIMGAGGALKQVIVDIGAGAAAGRLLAAYGIPLVVVSYLIAASLRAAQGSATVAIITAAGIIAPMLKAAPVSHPELVYLAVCLGGTFISHVNDAGFWLVNQYFGMTVPQTLRSWTVMKMITSVFGFTLVLIVWALLRG